MTNASKQLLEQFPIRKSKQQKADFRDWLTSDLRELGYQPRVEAHKGISPSHNVVVGDLSAAEVVVTAHYDTCAVMPFPNFITPRTLWFFLCFQALVALVTVVIIVGLLLGLMELGAPRPAAVLAAYAILIFILWWMLAGKANKSNVNDNTSGVITLLEIAHTLPEALRSKVAFVFFDNEEKGLMGSAAFSKAHKAEMADKLVLNFDCVSDGDHILFIPTKPLRKDPAALDRLAAAFPSAEGKQVEVCRTGFMTYPSDQKHFQKGVGVAACHHNKIIGHYLGRIHTGRDTVLMEENIELLRRGVLNLLQA